MYKPIVKTGYLDIKTRNHPTLTLYSKNSLPYFDSLPMLFLKRFYAYILLNLSNLHPAAVHSEHARLCVVMNNECFSRGVFKNIYILSRQTVLSN